MTYNEGPKCNSFPLQRTFIPQSATSTKLFRDVLRYTPPLWPIMAAGLSCTVTSTTLFAARAWSPRVHLLSVGFNVLSFFCHFAFALFTLTIVVLSRGIRRNSSLQIGEAYVGAIGNLSAALAHIIVAFTCLRYSF